MGKGIYFAGRNIVKPGAYATVNADAMVPNRPGAANVIGVIGTALGGNPQTVTQINDPITAQNVLRGGTLLQVIELMYNPSPELPGADAILFYRLNAALQATLNLQDVTPANVIALTAKDYGVHTNQLRAKVENASVTYLVGKPGMVVATPSSSGGSLATNNYFYKITAIDANGVESLPSAEVSASVTGPSGSVALTWAAVQGAASYRVYRGTSSNGESAYQAASGTSFTDTGAAGTSATPPATSKASFLAGRKVSLNDVTVPTVVEVGDNLGAVFQIQYIGSLYGARLSIAKTGDVATSLTLQTQNAIPTDPWVTVLTADLTNPNIATMGALAAYLAAQANFTCSIIGDPNEAVGDLDAVTNQDIKTNVYLAFANIGAITNWINANSQLVTAARVPSAINAPAVVPYTYLSGGSEGAVPQNSDWQNAINAFANQNIRYLFVCSENATIHAMALAHCTAMSDVKVRKERRCFVGGALGETVAQVTARAQALADKRAQLCYPGIQIRDLVTGNVDLLSPMYGAAILCGMKAGSTPETPLTFKAISVIGLETTLQLSDIETLLNDGVTPLEPAPGGGFRVVQDITTYLVDNNVIWRKGFGVDIADYLNSQVRGAVERFVGRTGDETTVHSILNAAASMLRQLTRSRTNPTGVLTAGQDPDTGAPVPSFQDLTAVFDGFDLVALTYTAHPVGEVAYITITAGLTPTQIVVKNQG